jgi:deoxyribose-phosphate aldolase
MKVTHLPPWLARLGERHGIGALVDHTLLRPEATEADIVRLCEEAVRLGLGQVCVNGQWVGIASRQVGTALTRVVTVVGFPLGASGLTQKAAETRLAVADGAAEIDMVMSLGSAKADRWDQVGDEIEAVVQAAQGRSVKVILETSALTSREVTLAARTAVEAGARAVKTSTGFHPAGGATPEAVALLRQTVGPMLGVKASGGIRTPEMAIAMLRAGADRIGSSAAASWSGIIGPDAPTIAELLAG